MTRIVEANLESSAGKLDHLPVPSLPEVAFAGRSNVGKSSLLNAVCARRSLFKVSKTPGRTRTIIHARARFDTGGEVYVVDLPGYGYAEVARGAKRAWAKLLESYLNDRPTLMLVVLLVDVRRGLEREEEELLGFLAERNINALLVATKIDRLGKSERMRAFFRLKESAQIPVIGTSAQTRDGIPLLVETMARATGFAPIET